jgi:ATP-dependent DNA ligase
MAIRGGVITQAEAIAAHKLSADELVAWLNAVERRDFEALRARQRRAA